MIKVDAYLHACKNADGEEWKDWGAFIIMDVLSTSGVDESDFKLITECLEGEGETELEPERWYRLSMKLESYETEYYPERFRKEWGYYILSTEELPAPEKTLCEGDLEEIGF